MGRLCRPERPTDGDVNERTPAAKLRTQAGFGLIRSMAADSKPNPGLSTRHASRYAPEASPLCRAWAIDGTLGLDSRQKASSAT